MVRLLNEERSKKGGGYGGISVELRDAAKKGDLEAVKVLPSNDAQSRPKARGKMALAYAAENGHAKVVEFLIRSGSPVDERDQRGRTALMHATGKHQSATVAILLAHGASLNVRDTAGWTPLCLALMMKSTDIAVSLIDAGVGCQAVNDKGDHALVIAVWLGNQEVVQTLLDRSVPVDGQTAYKALATAIHWKHLRIVQSLLHSRPDAAREGERHLSLFLKQTLSAEGERHERQRGETKLALMEIAAPPTDAELADLVRILKKHLPESLSWLREHGMDVNPKGREARGAFVKTILREDVSLPARIAQVLQEAMNKPNVP